MYSSTNNNNNERGVAMRPYDKLSEAPGFQEFQQLLEVNGVYLDGRTLSFADRKDTYIVVGSYITIFDAKDSKLKNITLNILFAVGEQMLLWATVQWWMDEGKFISSNDEYGLSHWGNSFGYKAKLYREVISAFKAWFTEGVPGGNILFDPEFGENLNSTSYSDLIKWFKWIPDDVEKFLQNQYEEEE